MASTRLARLKAILYLHALRTWRYKYSFINSSINMLLWITILILGVIMFVPSEELGSVVPNLFWGIVVWNMISYTVIYVAGWTTWFLVATGLIEEHILHNTRLSMLLMGRLITVAAELAIAVPLVYAVLGSIAGHQHLITNPLLLVYGAAAAEAMALGYALTISALGLRLNIPGTLLDVVNFLLFIIGGIAAPIVRLPEPLRIVAILTPYSHAAEVVRYAATGTRPYLGLWVEIVVSGVLAAALLTTGIIVYRLVEDRYIRRYGVRGLGRM
ncbi:hypothetical protein PYJP_05820 [Pyrofollis japonicus]|uniref:ABC transporter permease n=1 Tax=Pyrofollis japonicus TaxID=3060460 RepID=UPI00295AFB7B|nr:ABC transporter permease [Pyrofollis japonicus]BEP17230.1 hypothetical protein PYJP_05820 [Pyrofollis japonicus]